MLHVVKSPAVGGEISTCAQRSPSLPSSQGPIGLDGKPVSFPEFLSKREITEQLSAPPVPRTVIICDNEHN